MKFKGKKTIMAAALASIVAAASLSSAAMADEAPAEYKLSLGFGFNNSDIYGHGIDIRNKNDEKFPDYGVAGEIYNVVATPGNGASVLMIALNDIPIYYPNDLGDGVTAYYYPFVMPHQDCHVTVTFGIPGSLTPPPGFTPPIDPPTVEPDPVESEPENSVPVESEPESSDPIESEPESSVPVESEPESSDSVESQPGESNAGTANPPTGPAMALIPVILIGGAAVIATIKKRS